MKYYSRILLSFLVLLAGLPAFAQTTSSLTGTVTTDGNPLPGATVTISSPALQGVRTTVTSDTGGYNFPALPPGVYSIRFELDGLQPVTRTSTLALAQASRVDADLRVAAISEAITVTATAPAVLETTQISTNITSSLVDQLPVQRNILNAVALAPGVAPGLGGRADNANLGFSIAGAASSDNVFLVNGVVVNENLRGQPHNLFIEDAIQETTIITGGVSAEYGRFTGGVISTITKSGGNEFSGSFRDSFTNPSWTKRAPNQTVDNADVLNEVYEATLGGFIFRDRLWFFGAGRLTEADQQFFTTLTNVPWTRVREETRLEGKLTAQITPKHSLVGSYLDITDDLVNDFQFNIMDTQSLFNRSLPNSLYSVQYNGILSNNFLLEALYSNKEFAFVGSGSPFRDLINGTLLVDISNTNRRWWTSTFCGTCTDEERNNDLMALKANYFLSSSRYGTHNIVGGAENFAEERIANNHQSGSDFRIFHTVVREGTELRARFDSNTVIQWNPIFAFSQGTDLETQSVFVNDKWDVNNRLSVNLGVRFDKNDAKDADGKVVSDDSELSPRLGLQYDLTGSGRHRLNASYGRYVNKVADGNVAGSAQSAGNPSAFQYAYRGPVINPAGTPFNQLVPTADAIRMLFEWFNGACDSAGRCGTSNQDVMTFSFVSGLGTRLEGSIKSPSVDELTVGYGLQIASNAYLRTDLVLRDWQNFYSSRLTTATGRSVDQFGNVGDVGVTENTNDITREYRAAMISGQWNPSRFNVGGNYTWSKLEGNDITEGVTTANTPIQTLAGWYPEYLGYAKRNPEGYLPEDARHRLRGWVGYDFGLGAAGKINASVLHTYMSGRAYSAAAFIDATGRTAGTQFPGIAENPGYRLSQAGTNHTYFFSDRGEFRTDEFNSTDLAVTYTLPISRVNIFLQGSLINAFNNDGIINPNGTVLTRRNAGAASGLVAFNPFTTTPIECPQGAAAAQCTAMGAHWQKGTSFGGATDVNSYQLPRTYNFSAGIRF
ncbi:MAG TPA: TonB-dependent receptor [Thermoanaerobaculia bacterium]|nr:TonB-dependent receptor [Thermoanaerobaculia bacterium]